MYYFLLVSNVWKYEKAGHYLFWGRKLKEDVRDLTRSEMGSVKKGLTTSTSSTNSSSTALHFYVLQTQLLAGWHPSLDTQELILKWQCLTPLTGKTAGQAQTLSHFHQLFLNRQKRRDVKPREGGAITRGGVSGAGTAHVGMKWPTMWPVMLHPGHLPPTSHLTGGHWGWGRWKVTMAKTSWNWRKNAHSDVCICT